MNTRHKLVTLLAALSFLAVSTADSTPCAAQGYCSPAPQPRPTTVRTTTVIAVGAFGQRLLHRAARAAGL